MRLQTGSRTTVMVYDVVPRSRIPSFPAMFTGVNIKNYSIDDNAHLHFQLLLLVFKQVLVQLILFRADLICKHVIAVEVVGSHVRVAQYTAGTEELLLGLQNMSLMRQ